MTITLSNGNTYTSESLRGATGPQGEQGIQGPPGNGLQILDVYPTLSDLETAHPTGQPGDAYQVGTAPSFTLYIWSTSQSQWVPAGTLGSVSPSLTDPLMDDTASPGSSDLYSRGDHVHPTDTSRASASDLNDLSDMINESESLLNQEFTYRQSPAEYDGLANIDKIKGNTLVFNQLVQNGNFVDTSIWSSNAYISKSASNNIMNVTNAVGQDGDYFTSQNIPMVIGHKYYFHAEGKQLDTNSEQSLLLIFYGQASDNYVLRCDSTQNWFKANIIFTCASNTYNSIRLRTQIANGTNQFKNVSIVDLTQMFGEGNEPTSVSDFTDLFPLPYYDYNTGSLLSFNATEIKSIGFNQWDEEWEVGGLDVQSGIPYTDNSRIRTKNFNPCFENTVYYNSAPQQAIILFYDGNLGYLGYVGANSRSTFTTNANAKYFKFYMATAYGTTYNNDICINISDTAKNGTYEPYIENTLPLPISTYFPTGMKSVGTVYDELTSSKAITRIGSVDLGTINWSAEVTSGTNKRFVSDGIKTLSKHPSSSSEKANIRCSMFETLSGNEVYTENTGVSMNTQGQISIYSPNYQGTGTEFKNAMNGVYLFYELATPTEQDIDINLTSPIWNDGTEQLLPINTSTPVTTPIICDITYLGINDEILYLYNRESDLSNLENDVVDLQAEIGSESTTPKTGILGRVNALESDVSDIETEIGSDSTTPMTGLAGRIKTIENTINNLKGKVVFEYTSTSNNQGLTNTQLNLTDLNNATHIEVVYSKYLNGNVTLSTGIIPYKFYNPASIEINGSVSDHQMDHDRDRSWGISSSGVLTINSCTTYYSDSTEVTNDYLIIRQVILYKLTRASDLI